MSHVPLFALGTGVYTERIRHVMSRLCGRSLKSTEDSIAATTEALEAIATRIEALERAASRRHKSP